MRILSLGAGVQSSALYLLFDSGELSDPPDYAIFADTQGEPSAVYDYLGRLRKHGKIPIIVASKGVLADNPGKIPFFVKHPDGKRGMGWRQCTNDYKIQVVNREIRKLAGLKPRQRMKTRVEVIIGISTDEAKRRKEPREKWKTHRFPLIDEMKWSREKCKEYLRETDLGLAPRSACVYCPYRSNREWREMKKDDPGSFAMACDYDDSIRGTRKRFGKTELPQYVHPSLIPLRDVDLSDPHGGQMKFKFGDDEVSVENDMNSECEGMCGL